MRLMTFALMFCICGLLFSGCGMPDATTPLGRAACDGDVPLVRQLAAGGADPDELDDHGLTAMIYAARLGSVEVMEALLSAGASPDRPDHFVNGWTPLMHAVHKGQIGAVRSLLDAGADANARAWGGASALLLASGDCRTDIVRLLLERGADPAVRADSGATPLMNAVAAGNEENVRALLERDPSLRLGRGLGDRLALIMARARGRSDLAGMVAPAGGTREGHP